MLPIKLELLDDFKFTISGGMTPDRSLNELTIYSTSKEHLLSLLGKLESRLSEFIRTSNCPDMTEYKDYLKLSVKDTSTIEIDFCYSKDSSYKFSIYKGIYSKHINTTSSKAMKLHLSLIVADIEYMKDALNI